MERILYHLGSWVHVRYFCLRLRRMCHVRRHYVFAFCSFLAEHLQSLLPVLCLRRTSLSPSLALPTALPRRAVLLSILVPTSPRQLLSPSPSTHSPVIALPRPCLRAAVLSSPVLVHGTFGCIRHRITCRLWRLPRFCRCRRSRRRCGRLCRC